MATAGFFVASRDHDHWLLLIEFLIGMSLVIASGCVFNNYLDREIDRHMERTRYRALVKKTIAARSALLYASVLGLLGLGILLVYTNLATALIGVDGLFFYVVVYGVAKRSSEHSTLVGSIPGATPPLAGYVAVSGHIDVTAGLLFLILVFWQMPHFYSIAMYRIEDYKAAKLPVLPIRRGLARTQRDILLYIVAFTITTCLLGASAHLSGWYYVLALVLGLYWFISGYRGLQLKSKVGWARSMFRVSLIVLSLLCVAIVVASYTS